jgi:hypothetical protein
MSGGSMQAGETLSMWGWLVRLWNSIRGKKTMSLPHQGLALTGTVTVLREVPGAPTVYLVDEKHKHDPSADENIQNAILLVEQADARLAGVEGYEGGRLFDDFDSLYRRESINGDLIEVQRIGDYPRFANALSTRTKVVGVDCRGLCGQVDVAIANGDLDKDKSGDHPNQPVRSKHFITTLFEERRRLGLGGNLILNCGGKHNARLADMVQDGTIDDLTGEAASYVRLRASS